MLLQLISDTDECANAISLCGRGAECINLNGSFDCRCRAGFQTIGDNCTGRSVSVCLFVY